MKTNVKNLSPLDRLVYWITERESIRLKKEGGAKAPWTDDIILQSYRFCNVRRMDDKVSKWLLENWYRPNYDHKNIVIAATIGRMFNNIDSLTEIGFPKVWSQERVLRKLENRVELGLKNFSAAYMITGTLGGTKIEQIVNKVVNPLFQFPSVLDTASMENSVAALIPRAGFSTFMAGQVVADLRWAMKGSWNDKYEWAPIGPGSRRGMNRLNEKDLKSPMKQKEFTVLLKELMFVLRKKLPKTIQSRMEAMDFQNSLCEFDKYERTLFDNRRPKQRYKGN